MLYLEPLLIALKAQQAEIADLKEKLKTDSTNSSKPPSTSFKKTKTRSKLRIKNLVKNKAHSQVIRVLLEISSL